MKQRNSEANLSTSETASFEGSFFEKSTFKGEFSESSSVPVTFSETQLFSLKLDNIVSTTTSDHSRLQNLDKPDQHPIEAVTGLNNALGGKLNGEGALSNCEIEFLLTEGKFNYGEIS